MPTKHPAVRTISRATPIALLLLLGACGGASDTLEEAVRSMNIERMECPISGDGATIPPGTNSKVKAYVRLTGINEGDVVWSWDADSGAVVFGALSTKDNSSTIDIKAPGSPAKYKINVHATANGKRADSTCELEVK